MIKPDKINEDGLPVLNWEHNEDGLPVIKKKASPVGGNVTGTLNGGGPKLKEDIWTKLNRAAMRVPEKEKPEVEIDDSDPIGSFSKGILANTFQEGKVKGDIQGLKLSGGNQILKEQGTDKKINPSLTAELIDKAKKEAFPTTNDAESWLNQEAERNNGYIAPSNTTANVAKEMIDDKKNVTDILINNNNDLEAAAIQYYGSKSDLLGEKIRLMNGNVPEVLKGNLLSEFLELKPVKELASESPNRQANYNEQRDNIMLNYPEVRKQMILQKIGQGREDFGYNNPLLNLVGKKSSDEIVNTLVATGQLSEADKEFYNEIIRPSIAIEGIQTPGLIESGLGSTAESIEAVPKSVMDITGISSLTTEPADRVYDEIKKDYSSVNVNFKGTNKVSNAIGHLTGVILPIGGEAKLLQGLNIIKNANTANRVMMAATFYHGLYEENLKAMPNDEAGAHFAAVLQTLVYDRISKVLPSLAKNVTNEINPSVRSVMERLATNKITGSAAAQEITSTVLSKTKDAAVILGDAAVKNVKMATEMGLATVINENIKDVFSGKHTASFESGAATFETMLLGGGPLALISARGKNRKVTADMYNEMAERPEYFEGQIKKLAEIDAEFAKVAPQYIENLKHLTSVHEALKEREDLTPEQKKKFQLLSVSQKLIENKIKKSPDKGLNTKDENDIAEIEIEKKIVLDPELSNTKIVQEFYDNELLGKGSLELLSVRDADGKPTNKFDPSKTGEYLKEVAQRTNNLDSDWKPNSVGNSSEAAKSSYPEAVVEIANKRWAKEIEQATKKKGVSIIMPEENKSPDIVPLKNTETAVEPPVSSVDALKDVESTAKALDAVPDEQYTGLLNKFFAEDRRDMSAPEAIAKEYHTAKADGSNPELVKAVEEAIGKPVSSVEGGEVKSMLGSDVDLKGEKKEAWMDNPIDRGKRISELEQKNDKEEITDTEYDELKELRKGQKHTSTSVLPTLDALSKKFNGIKNVSDAEQNSAMVVWDAINDGKYQKAIEEGRITAQDAKTIIESAGLEVPKDIIEQVQPEQSLPKGEAAKQPIAQNEKAETTPIPNKTEAESADIGTSEKIGEATSEGTGGKEPPKETVIETEAGEIGGITQAANEVRRKDTGLSEFERNPQSFEQWNREAEKLLKEGYDVEALMKRLQKGDDATPVENAIRKIYYATVDAEVAKNPTDALLSLQKRNATIGDEVNRRAGQNLVSLKGENSPLDSISDFYVAKMEAAGVDKLTEKQKQETKEAFDNVQKADANATAAMEAYLEEISKLKAENELLKQKKESRKSKQKDVAEERKQIVGDILLKLSKARGESASFLGAAELASIAPDVLRLVKNIAVDASLKLAEIVDRVHDLLKDGIPDLEKKNIHDIIAGEFNKKRPTRSELAIKMRDLKDEAYYANKLQRLLSGTEPTSEKKKVKRNQEITDLRQKIETFKKTERDAAKEPKEEIPDEVKKLQAIVKRNEKQESDIREKIRKGDFETNKEVPFLENPEMQKKFPQQYKAALDAIVKRDDARHEFDLALLKDQMAKRSVIKKGIDLTGDVIGTTKAVVTGIDASGIAIQNLVAMVTHPRSAAKALPGSVADLLSGKTQERWLAVVHNSKVFQLSQKAGLDITEPKSLKASEREELFTHNLLDRRIKYKGKTYVISKYTTKPFERLFTGLGNRMRWNLWVRGVEKLQEDGFTFEKHPEEFKSLAKVLNTETGRGTLHPQIEKAFNLVSAGIWSPRLMASRMNILGLGDIGNLIAGGKKGYYGGLTPRMRAYALKDLGKFIIFGTSLMGLAGLTFADDVDFDPNSSTFGTFSVNGKRYNIWGGFTQYVRFVAKLIMGGEKSDGVFRASSPLKTTGRFLWSKTTPAVNLGIGLLNKDKEGVSRDYMGQPITPLGAAASVAVPLSIRGIIKGVEKEGLGSILWTGVPSFIGLNVSYESDFNKDTSNKEGKKESGKKEGKKQSGKKQGKND